MTPYLENTTLALSRREFQDQASATQSGFLGFKTLCELVPLSERTLRKAVKKGQIPHIRLPGARRLLFDWETTRQAILRFQRGGVE